MKHSEAARLVAMLGAFHNRDIAQDTAALWVRELADYELEDGLEAVQVLGTSGRFLPALSELIDAIRDCRNRRLSAQAKPLPSGGAPYYPLARAMHEVEGLADRVRRLGIPAHKDDCIPPTFAKLLREELGQ